MKKRWMAWVLSAVMLIGLVPAASASDLDGHWAKNFIEYLNQEGVYNPSATTGDYDPNREMTRAEFMRYINRAFHFTETTSISYSDVKTTAWYYETVQIAAKYGYINGVGNNKMDPEGKVTREQAAVLIGRLFKADPGGVSPSDLVFQDKGKVSTWSAGYIKAANEKGFLAGYTDGTFRPQKVVTRAEVAKILYYYLGTSLSTAGKAYTGADLKSDTTNVTISENCTLSDATIAGDLYITEGLGSDAVTLTNVTVQGSIIVSGGTVTLMNTTSDHMIIESSMGRLLQVTATGASHIRNTEIGTNASLYERGLSTSGYDGFVNASVNGESRITLTLDAALTNLDLNSAVSVSMTSSAAVYQLNCRQVATVTGYGKIYQADIRVAGVSLAMKPSGYTLASGVTATVAGATVSTSSEAAVSPTTLAVDLNNLSTLGASVDISVPSGVTVATVTCDGTLLSSPSAYTKSDTGLRVLTSYLGTLTKGSHAMVLTMSDGNRVTVTIDVTNSSANADAVELSFDRYYKSKGFVDLSVRLSGASAQSDISGVVLGMTSLDYEFNSSARDLILRRGTLAQLRTGTYTITVDLASGASKLILLTVTDSAPDSVTALVAEYDTYNPVEPQFALGLDRLSVRSVTTMKNGSAQTLSSGTDYVSGTRALTLKKTALEKYRRSGEYVEFTVTLSDNSVATLVIDYI